MSSDFKTELLNYCKGILEERISHIEMAMAEAQSSANTEEKSSAGDKYETGRAMQQIAREMNAKQRSEALRDLDLLMKINLQQGTKPGSIYAGSMVETTAGTYFIAAGIGPVVFRQKQVIVISPMAPLAKALTGHSTGDTFSFNGKQITILQVS